MGWFSRQMERSKQHAEEHRLDAHFEGWRIMGDKFIGTESQRLRKWPVSGVHAEVISGQKDEGMSLAAVAAGGMLFGPVGAIIGGMGKYDRTRCYLVIQLPDGKVVSDDFPAAKYGELVAFVAQVNAAAASFANRG